jgi:hypothetical protein
MGNFLNQFSVMALSACKLTRAAIVISRAFLLAFLTFGKAVISTLAMCSTAGIDAVLVMLTSLLAIHISFLTPSFARVPSSFARLYARRTGFGQNDLFVLARRQDRPAKSGIDVCILCECLGKKQKTN